jgi:hypothetical protein
MLFYLFPHQTPWFPRGMHAHILLVSYRRIIALPLPTRPADEEIEYLLSVATLVTVIPKNTSFFLHYIQRLSLSFLFNLSLPLP